MRTVFIIAILAVSAFTHELEERVRGLVPQSVKNFAASLVVGSEEFEEVIEVLLKNNKDETISKIWAELKKSAPASFIKKAEEFVRELRAEVDAIDNEDAKKFVNQVLESDEEATTLFNIVFDRDDYWHANAEYAKAEKNKIKAIVARYAALNNEARKSIDGFAKIFKMLAELNL